ncbi:MAG TPA: PAS domain-containing sensor histidine kinase [Candidatus Paceibacterota bacterium]|nr:PAS domain-containing sensor histidine kinase [Candidatus Paceibacterota bacterium]
MHKTLEEQIKQIVGDKGPPSPEAWAEFLKTVDRTYEEYDTHRARIESYLANEMGSTKRHTEELEVAKKAMLNLLEDIDEEKKKVEEKVRERTKELQEEHSRLITSIDSLALGFILTARDGKVLAINRAARQLLGFDDNSTELPNIHQITEKFQGAFNLEDLYNSCLAKRQSLDTRDVSFNKRFLWVFVSPIVVAARPEEAIGTAILIDDITEARILERTREEFFSIASHELRTPLTAIRGNASLIKDFYAQKNDPETMKEIMRMVDDIHQSSIRLIAIVNDFLDASRLEQKKIEFNLTTFAPLDLLRTVVKEFEKMANDAGVALVLEEPADPLPNIFADQDRTKQIIINLIGNALNYTRQGGITVKAERDGDNVKIIVSDTGVGIAPENQPLLFRKFQQAGTSILTRDATRGTGLGLYISKLLAESMNGGIELVRSEVGKGSTFCVVLPVARA